MSATRKARRNLLTSRDAFLDRMHVIVREAEMVADLVHQHMRDDRPQGLLVLAPIVEDRPAVEPDHVGHVSGRRFGAERQADALEQAEQVELALGADLVHRLVGRKILDLNDQVLAQRAEFARQPAKRLDRDELDLIERGRLDGPPGERIGKWSIISHATVFRAFSGKVDTGFPWKNATKHRFWSGLR